MCWLVDRCGLFFYKHKTLVTCQLFAQWAKTGAQVQESRAIPLEPTCNYLHTTHNIEFANPFTPVAPLKLKRPWTATFERPTCSRWPRSGHKLAKHSAAPPSCTSRRVYATTPLPTSSTPLTVTRSAILMVSVRDGQDGASGRLSVLQCPACNCCYKQCFPDGKL